MYKLGQLDNIALHARAAGASGGLRGNVNVNMTEKPQQNNIT